jgi:hypothetical protein
MPKMCMYTNSIPEGLHHPSFKSLVSAKKQFPQRPIAQYEFRIWTTRQIWNRIRIKCSKVNRGLNGVDCWTKAEHKNLTLLFLYVHAAPLPLTPKGTDPNATLRQETIVTLLDPSNIYLTKRQVTYFVFSNYIFLLFAVSIIRFTDLWICV